MRLLTIGIPTYKSNATLLRLLDSILNQLTLEIFEEVEVVISDNDPASELVHLLKSKLSATELSQIRYFRNPTNVGYDKNLEKLRYLASGKYLKIVADDDILDYGYVVNHLETLRDKNPDIVINEFQTFNSDQPESIHTTLPLTTNFYSPPWSFRKHQELNGRFGQVSSLTFRLALLRGIPDQAMKTNFVHIFWFYSLLESSNLVYEKKITIFCQLGSPNFSSSPTEIVSTPFGGVTAVRLASIKDLDLRKKVMRSSQNYALRQLRIVPNLTFKQKYNLFKNLYLELFYSLPTSLIYLPLFFVPKAIKMQLDRLKKFMSKTL